jgi:hypothetical protein
MRARRTIMTTVLIAGMALGYGGPAWAAAPGEGARAAAPGGGADALPEGWAVTAGKAGPVLTWQAPARVPMGDAAVEFYADGRLLGRPQATKDQRSFRLDIAGVRPSELSGLEVRAGGRRLDVTGAAQQSAARVPSAPEAAAATPPLPKNPVDPGKKGTYQTVTGEYTLPGVKLPDFPEKVEMQGVVVAPKGATGKRPLALFLHGRHFTCFTGADEDKITGDWPCAAGSAPVPSHRGYLQAQQLLASQGYVTVSISANGINGQDWAADDGGAQARSSLVRLHLAKWADWAGASRSTAPAIVKTAPVADLSKVLLMGHSRGGEGVNRAALDSLSVPPAAQDGYKGKVRWTIRGTVLIGPTIFGHNPAPDVPSVTILPGCDGDVSDLQGQIYVDATRGVSRGAALHSAVFVVGANHNFFNTEWTPGQSVAPSFDDFGSETPDKVCTPGTAKTRLTATQQQNVGATYIAAAGQLFVAGNDKVRPLLDGSGFRAASADPARVLSHAVGANRSTLVVPGSSTKVTGTGARLCSEVTSNLKTACTDPESYAERSPHFVGFTYPEPGRYAVALKWSTARKTVTLKPSKAVSIKGAKSVALRVVVPANSTGTRFDVRITDTKGHRAKLGTVRVDGLPGSSGAVSYWGQEVRVPLTAAGKAKVDLRKVAKLELVPLTAKGKAWVIDAWGWRTGTPAPKPLALPRVDVGLVEVKEGDSGSRTYQVPVKVTGRGNATVRLFLTDPKTYKTTVTVVTIKPTTRTLKVPIKVTGNKKYGDDLPHSLQAKTVKGAVIGDYTGGVLVRDDDPMPKVTVQAVADTVTEGATLTWRVKLSTTADAWIFVGFPAQPPAGGAAELSTTDVDPEWLLDMFGEEALPSRPLSGLIGLYADLAPGQLSSDVTLPTITDTVTEPDEKVQLQTQIYPRDFGEPTLGPLLTGTVTNKP